MGTVDIVVIVVVVLLLFMLVGGRIAPGRGYAPTFAGADILWTILLVLAVIWLARRLF